MSLHKQHQSVIIVFGIFHALTQFSKLNNEGVLKAIDSNHAVNQVLSRGVLPLFLLYLYYSTFNPCCQGILYTFFYLFSASFESPAFYHCGRCSIARVGDKNAARIYPRRSALLFHF